jgi:MFS family permease
VRDRNRILVVMVVSILLGYMPWYNFSAVLRFISADFALTPEDTGLILAAFQAGYVLVVPFTGWLADRIGLKTVLFWATLATGLFSVLFAAAAQDKWTTLALRLLTGLSAGAILVPGMALISRWFPPSKRGGALGAYTGALVVAYAGGYFIAAPVAAAYGWRMGILWTSLPAIAAALIIHLLVREAPPGAEQEDRVQPNAEGVRGGSAEVQQELRPDRAVGAGQPLASPEGGYKGPAVISLSYMGHMWELFAFWGWIGPFMVAAATVSGMPPIEAVTWGGAMAAAVILIGAPAAWIWGVVADRRGRTWAIIVASALSLVAQLFLGFLFGQHLALVVLAAAWIGFWVIADSAIYKAGLTEMVLPTVRGTYLGLQSAAGFFMTIPAPLVFGLVLGYYNGSVDPTTATVWGPPFVVLGLGALLAPAAALVLRRLPQAKLMSGGRM